MAELSNCLNLYIEHNGIRWRVIFRTVVLKFVCKNLWRSIHPPRGHPAQQTHHPWSGRHRLRWHLGAASELLASLVSAISNSQELLGRTALGFPFSGEDLKSQKWLEIKPSKIMIPDRRGKRKVLSIFICQTESNNPKINIWFLNCII